MPGLGGIFRTWVPDLNVGGLSSGGKAVIALRDEAHLCSQVLGCRQKKQASCLRGPNVASPAEAQTSKRSEAEHRNLQRPCQSHFGCLPKILLGMGSDL
ncbi:hypothetical protein AAFF_G00400600 [Aldrovandia affinis]|uniref:Uncharacterized protein n=1 Tax=Aldrovandia affinis TaxID=143900 RepID=A0AAD7SCB8_9TELE|nr:hypothetical protein AAFF_G00400600 [Aldrovandia affinis]